MANILLLNIVPRERFSSSADYDAQFGANYWLRQYLYIRLSEVSAAVDEYRFNQIMKKVYTLHRVKGYHNAVRYINRLIRRFQPNATITEESLGTVGGISNKHKIKHKRRPKINYNKITKAAPVTTAVKLTPKELKIAPVTPTAETGY